MTTRSLKPSSHAVKMENTPANARSRDGLSNWEAGGSEHSSPSAAPASQQSQERYNLRKILDILLQTLVWPILLGSLYRTFPNSATWSYF